MSEIAESAIENMNFIFEFQRGKLIRNVDELTSSSRRTDLRSNKGGLKL